MDTLYPTACLTLIYLVLVIVILPKIMKKRSEFQMKYLIFSYNILLIALNLYITFKMLKIKFKSNDFGLCTKIQANDNSNNNSKKVSTFKSYYHYQKPLNLKHYSITSLNFARSIITINKSLKISNNFAISSCCTLNNFINYIF